MIDHEDYKSPTRNQDLSGILIRPILICGSGSAIGVIIANLKYWMFGWSWWILIGLALEHVALVGLFWYQIYRARFAFQPLNEAKGSSRWANDEDIAASGLLDDTPGENYVYLGGWPTKDGTAYLRHANGHTLGIGPSGSQKTVSMITTILSWGGSLVVNDIKGTLFQTTSQALHDKGYIVVRLDPSWNDMSLPRGNFNPLHEIRIGTLHEMGDAQRVSTMSIDPENKGLSDYWSKASWSFINAIYLHVLYAELDKSLPGVSAFINNPDLSLAEICEIMMTTHHRDYVTDWQYGDSVVHPGIAEAVKEFIDKAAGEASGVIGTLRTNLAVYRDPKIAGMMRTSDYRVMDLQLAERPLAIFLNFPPSDRDRIRPYVRMLFNQLVLNLMETLRVDPVTNRPKYKHKVLLAIDEMPWLHKMAIFSDLLGVMREYGIFAFMLGQNISQFLNLYGEHVTEHIVDSCNARYFYRPNSRKTAGEISAELGDKTERMASRMRAGGVTDVVLNHTTLVETDDSRVLSKPDEIKRLPDNLEVLFYSGCHPIKCKKIPFFQDANLKAEVEKGAYQTSDAIVSPDNSVYINMSRSATMEYIAKKAEEAAEEELSVKESGRGRSRDSEPKKLKGKKEQGKKVTKAKQQSLTYLQQLVLQAEDQNTTSS